MMQRTNFQETPTATASWLDKADEFARNEPTKAVASAASVGFLINLLPIGAIVGALVSVSFALVRPVLLSLGLLKAIELLRSKSTNENSL